VPTGAVVITRIAGAILAVADQDVMIAFFERLGFTTTTDSEMWPGARWVEVLPPGAQTALVLSPAAAFGRDPDTAYPMTFACDDLNATATALRADGFEVDGPTTEPWGSYIQVADPEGRKLLVSDRG
jgi:predicted enzyme related to lactoylglutathione lyase